ASIRAREWRPPSLRGRTGGGGRRRDRRSRQPRSATAATAGLGRHAVAKNGAQVAGIIDRLTKTAPARPADGAGCRRGRRPRQPRPANAAAADCARPADVLPRTAPLSPSLYTKVVIQPAQF